MLKDKLLYGTNFCAVEHTVDENGKEQFHCLILEKRKKELLKKESVSFSNLKDLLFYLKDQQHIFLIVNNNQILSKKSDSILENDLKTIQYNFPNILISDFYSEVVNFKNSSFISICRKEAINNLVKQYEDSGISIVDVSLGNLSFTQILSFIEEKRIYTSNTEIQVDDNEIVSIQKNVFQSNNYNINGLDISNTELLSLSGIISGYLKKNTHQKEFKKTLSNKYLHKRIFILGFKVALGIIFIVLLINFLVFSHYHTKLNKLQSELQVNESSKNQLITLKKLVTTKEKLVQGLTNIASSSVTQKIDILTKNIPSSILLEELNYQPLSYTIKKEKPIKVNSNEIQIKGIINNNIDFTNWMNTIERLDWVDEISILKFGKEKSKQRSKTSFKILIQLK